MAVTLVLKGRQPDPLGRLTWHDGTVLLIALGNIVKDKPLGKLYGFMSIAGKIQQAMERDEITKRIPFGADAETGNELFAQKLDPITITVKNPMAHTFWQELENAPWHDYGVSAASSGTLYLMLKDIAHQLGEKMGDADEWEEEKE